MITHGDLMNPPLDARALTEIYDDWSKTYERDMRSWGYAAPEIAAGIAAGRLGTTERHRILDVGCGTGLCGEALRSFGFQNIHGVDLSDKSLAVAREKNCYITLNQGNAAVPVSGRVFDIIMAVGVLTYFDDPAPILVNLARSVVPGGTVIVTHRDDYPQLRFPENTQRIRRFSQIFGRPPL